MISHDRRAIQLEEKFNGSLGIWSQRSYVSQEKNLIYTAPPYVLKDSAKGHVVPVDVRQQRDPHRLFSTQDGLNEANHLTGKS